MFFSLTQNQMCIPLLSPVYWWSRYNAPLETSAHRPLQQKMLQWLDCMIVYYKVTQHQIACLSNTKWFTSPKWKIIIYGMWCSVFQTQHIRRFPKAGKAIIGIRLSILKYFQIPPPVSSRTRKSNGCSFTFAPLPRQMPLSSFILVEICVLRSSGWLAVYYSTPGALKVQGLAARKVTTGSPLNSCKLLAGLGEAGSRGGRSMPLLRVACRDPFCRSPPAPPLVWKEFLSWMLEAVRRGHRLYSYTAWPL